MDVHAGSLWLRVVLLYLTLMNALIGVWATFGPRSFFDDFPGAGRHWVVADGQYNEHLVRDVGAWSLALTVVTLAAAWSISRLPVIIAGVANAFAALPHAIYHSRHSDVLGSSADRLASIGGLWIWAGLGLAVAAGGMRLPRSADALRAAGVPSDP